MQEKKEKRCDTLTIDVPVKSHVRKYLDKQLNSAPLPVERNTSIGVILYSLFKSDRTDKQFSIESFTASYQVYMKDYYFFRHGVSNFSNYTYHKFNIIFDGMLKKDCYTYVSYSRRFEGKSKKQAIEDFMNSYNLVEEDISFDVLTKYMSRYQEMVSNQNPMFWLNGKPSKNSQEKNIENHVSDMS